MLPKANRRRALGEPYAGKPPVRFDAGAALYGSKTDNYGQFNFAHRQSAYSTCAGEASIKVGESPTRRIRLFTTQNGVRAVAVRRGRKQNVD
jgi:hypothetical protein